MLSSLDVTKAWVRDLAESSVKYFLTVVKFYKQRDIVQLCMKKNLYLDRTILKLGLAFIVVIALFIDVLITAKLIQYLKNFYTKSKVLSVCLFSFPVRVLEWMCAVFFLQYNKPVWTILDTVRRSQKHTYSLQSCYITPLKPLSIPLYYRIIIFYKPPN